jgi:hypothetical protein
MPGRRWANRWSSPRSTFNRIAAGQMEIELFYADQLVPTGELFQALQRGTIDAVQSDDDSMASPTEVTVFGGYFPLALRYAGRAGAVQPVRAERDLGRGICQGRRQAHLGRARGIPAISPPRTRSTAWPTCSGKRVFTFPTAGRFLAQFGVVPVTLPWEDIEVAVQTGELDGIAWSGITEVYTVGWSNVTEYFLTNNISGAWIGHFFANMDRWNEVPPHLQELMRVASSSRITTASTGTGAARRICA